MSHDAWPGRRGDLQALAREVSRLDRRLDAHEREHETAERAREAGARERERQRRSTRRYWVTTLAAVITSNLGTWVVLVATHHG